ncbi:hypothetical protein G7075_11740 [Phycicoccus sp. HDW14]|uniref:hypothetical protein n=1 Tax=Phycicoccus sp. HDW14 TaxID=2714941 RepID=UPI0014080CD7|nr:hypothetical protein [Phycicoccus sp. HDW14]QIM21642.1 hypothetical protein G7075_11740 [Phycicoccus sp. HDW14]
MRSGPDPAAPGPATSTVTAVDGTGAEVGAALGMGVSSGTSGPRSATSGVGENGTQPAPVK